ncbi:hypothetical protein AB0K09_30260 [Streptomyces sp. NPDC049577]|uniref:hypothetical protein n=1 Tax=Streptomyces sp. NPDC049577 TaxID=3155153 RepID=UPI00344375CB
MGWTVLYIAFGVVALWLLGEVLLQYKARLRWRLLAFVGFLGVVTGVVLPSVVVIVVGALAFAVGQTYVTLSFRRGFSAGWALRRSAPQPKSRSGRRRKSQRGAPSPAPTPTPAPASVPEPAPLAEQVPLPEQETAMMPSVPQQPEYGAYDAPDYGQMQGQPQGQYAAYSDPYIGNRQQPYDPYASQQYGMDTPPGGVWVPQQRDTDAAAPQQQPYQYYDEQQQYRY